MILIFQVVRCAPIHEQSHINETQQAVAVHTRVDQMLYELHLSMHPEIAAQAERDNKLFNKMGASQP
jgi:hypothetical protein